MARLKSEWFCIRPIVSCALICAISLTLFGLPISQPFDATTAKDLSNPFPCQHSRCGCTDAESCWKSCCCHTKKEQIDWYAKRDLQRPQDAIDEDLLCEDEFSQENLKHSNCCSQPTQRNEKSLSSVVFVDQDEAKRCGGLLTLFQLLSHCIVKPLGNYTTHPEVTFYVCVIADCRAVSLNIDPATPPPRQTLQRHFICAPAQWRGSLLTK